MLRVAHFYPEIPRSQSSLGMTALTFSQRGYFWSPAGAAIGTSTFFASPQSESRS
jgi:hypothetical protein